MRCAGLAVNGSVSIDQSPALRLHSFAGNSRASAGADEGEILADLLPSITLNIGLVALGFGSSMATLPDSVAHRDLALGVM